MLGVRRRAATAPAPFSESPKREAEKKRPYNFLERTLAAAKIESFHLGTFRSKRKKIPQALGLCMGRAAEAEEECRRFYTVRTLAS